MKNRTFAWLAGLILIFIISGYLISKSHKTDEVPNNYTAVVQDNGSNSRENIASNQQPSQQSSQQNQNQQNQQPQQPPPPQQPAKKPAAKPSRKPYTPPAPAPKRVKKPRVAGAAITNPTYVTYTNTGLSVRVTVPSAWQIREEDSDANNVTFYNGSVTYGAMKVLGFSGDTIASLRAHLQEIGAYNITDTTVSGVPALQYTNSAGTFIAAIYKGNTYTFSGQAAQPPFITALQFI